LEGNIIGCKRLSDDPDARLEKAKEAFADLLDFTFDSCNDNKDRVGQLDDEQEKVSSVVLQVINHVYILYIRAMSVLTI
jgi:hypothetical protein